MKIKKFLWTTFQFYDIIYIDDRKGVKNMESLIANFMRSDIDWFETLRQAPYNLHIIRNGKYVKFSRTQESDYNIPLVEEASDMVIDINTLRPVCWGYSDPMWDLFDVQLVWYDRGQWFFTNHNFITKGKCIINNTILNNKYNHLFLIGKDEDGTDKILSMERRDKKTGEVLKIPEETLERYF